MGLTPTERHLRARLAALTLHATHDSRELTAPARRAFDQKFLDQVPADLPEDERRRRADHLRKAHFTRLAYLSARARNKNKP